MRNDNKLKGRESYGTPYYPGVDFDLRDTGGKLWWNSDPDHWYGGNPERFNKSHQPVPGTVFPFLAGLYPKQRARIAPGIPAGEPDDSAARTYLGNIFPTRSG